jgi:hypothetical protein
MLPAIDLEFSAVVDVCFVVFGAIQQILMNFLSMDNTMGQ